MTNSGNQEKRSQPTQRRCVAVLTIPTGIGNKWSVAAKGESCESAVAALRSLFKVTATALEKFQGNVFKDSNTYSDVAGGLIDQSLLKQSGSGPWASVFGSCHQGKRAHHCGSTSMLLSQRAVKAGRLSKVQAKPIFATQSASNLRLRSFALAGITSIESRGFKAPIIAYQTRCTFSQLSK